MTLPSLAYLSSTTRFVTLGGAAVNIVGVSAQECCTQPAMQCGVGDACHIDGTQMYYIGPEVSADVTLSKIAPKRSHTLGRNSQLPDIMSRTESERSGGSLQCCKRPPPVRRASTVPSCAKGGTLAVPHSTEEMYRSRRSSVEVFFRPMFVSYPRKHRSAHKAHETPLQKGARRCTTMPCRCNKLPLLESEFV